MAPGDLLLIVALIAAALAAAAWFPGLKGRAAPGVAGWLFALHAAALVGAQLLLLALFAAHRFEVAYVAQYSSRALSPALSLAASWAGQEGSILLWATLAALVGLALLRQPGILAAPAMCVASLTQAFLVLLLVLKSPFRLQWPAPADGAGLNPLLQDPWMVIHPPVLFAGYAVLIAPFALAVAALARGTWREWGRAVWPWTLLAVALLGSGIALGGVWAYKVLGWGGYWGWDPVENASLVPWLVAVALLHGLLIQRTRGAMVRTNLVLALMAWLTVLGGTWLTRSGALQDFSVHSFADTGVGPPLIAFLLATLAGAGALLAARWSSLSSGDTSWATLSRESALWAGLVTVLVFAALVAFGTAAPVLTSLGGKPASVNAGFYERISLPLGIATVLLMGLAPALRWSRQAGWSWLRTLTPALLAGAATLVLLLVGRVREPAQLVLLVTSGAALGINAWMTVRLFRRGWSYGSGYLGHAGIAVMVLGMILSTALGRTERFRLAAGVPREAMGYRLTYLGQEVDEHGKHRLRVSVRANGREHEVHPELFRMPRGEGVMRKPYISRSPDMYLSPVEVEAADPPDGRAPWPAPGGTAAGAAVLELSTKPFVDLVWIGALLALMGAVMAGIRRAIEVGLPRSAPDRAARGAAG